MNTGARRSRTARITDMKSISLAPVVSALLLTSVLAQSPSEPGGTAALRTLPAASPRDGFTLRGADALITREGVTIKMDREVILPNGLRVLPNGNVTLPDGSTTTLRANQLLTFGGTLHEVALTPEGIAPLSSVSIGAGDKGDVGLSSRDGVTISGADVFLTRNGVTERLKSEVRLPNGVIARPDGTIVGGTGNRITMRPNQVLGLDGVLRDVPVRPNPPGPDPSSSTTTTSSGSSR